MADFKPKILVVDDDSAMLQLIGEVLTRSGARPHLVESSRQAAELVEKEKFDGAFLDWMMPEMDGLELARRIRRSRLNSRAPLVMLTGVLKRSAMQECFDAGIDYFLQKPVTVKQVQQLLSVSRGRMLAERREGERAYVVLRAKVSWEGGRRVGRTRSVSAHGCLLSVDKPPAKGTEVLLELTLPGVRTPLVLGGLISEIVPGDAIDPAGGVIIAFDSATRTRPARTRLAAFIEKAVADADRSA